MVRLAIIGLCLILASCQTTDSTAIVFAVATAPTVLDPRLASDAASERTNALLYDRLVSLDEQGMPQSAMADWQQRDPQRFLLTLRPQRAAFWDGSSRLPTMSPPPIAASSSRNLAHPMRVRSNISRASR